MVSRVPGGVQIKRISSVQGSIPNMAKGSVGHGRPVRWPRQVAGNEFPFKRIDWPQAPGRQARAGYRATSKGTRIASAESGTGVAPATQKEPERDPC